MDVTWLDSNSWLITLGGQRILVDPWLVGELVFGQQPWLFKGEHPQSRPLPEAIDLILLSQGLEDHAHPPTLKALDRTIPVVGSPSAAKVAESLGYSQVTALNHGETFILNQQVTIKAIPGAPVGPLVTENGYILRDMSGDRESGASLFYEPHGFHRPELKAEGPVDVVITPVVDLALPVVGPIIRGQQGALELIDWLQPQVVLPTADAGEVTYSGLLINWLKTVGDPQALQAAIAAKGLSTRVLAPVVGQSLPLNLIPRQPLATGV
ncbi:MBL fold metallo-hydrolase [Leptolyngbya sp. CCNP1308]|uniref:MBL fold metallo-hydrolase n=1 Tax=Leptolyngbya sp. CCNP1308 TaxID=3110255 RepID=UPI002B209E22|nr:MBL fold metallo-hydrolase [Leptolyngbya sp. CCNP1308]MEA5447495.1 MBL fold metallo-hydrolase [Leptolyngbya sp. CCNP1308]